MINYNIHDSVIIYVSEKVNSRLLSAIKHQLHYFHTASDPQDDTPFKIIIHPFEDRPVDSKEEHVLFSGKSLYSHGIITNVKEKNAFSYSTGKEEICLYLNSDSFDLIPYIQLALVASGKSLLHAAAIEYNGEVYLFPSISGGVGKTALIGNLLKKNPSFKMLGDDYVIVSATGKAFSYPKPMFLYEYHSSIYGKKTLDGKGPIKLPTQSRRIKLSIRRIIPFRKNLKTLMTYVFNNNYLNSIFFENQPYVQVLPEIVFGLARIYSSGKLRNVIQMQRYSGNEIKIKKSESSGLNNSMYSTLHYELREFWDPIYDFGRYDQMDLSEYYSSTKSILTSAFEGVPTYTLLVPEESNISWSEEIAHFINRHIHNESD